MLLESLVPSFSSLGRQVSPMWSSSFLIPTKAN